MKSPQGFEHRHVVFGVSLLMLASLCPGAGAQSSRDTYSIVGVANDGDILPLDYQQTFDNTPITAAATQSFTGLDGMGNSQTMTFSGNVASRSDYGGLHLFASGSLNNSYYNASNPAYADMYGNYVKDPNGSPTTLISLGLAYFTDTLQYGGDLKSGYKARYIFHIDGTNSGTGVGASLGVTVDNNPSQAFTAFNDGSISTDWVTADFDVNGIVPQSINVGFAAEVAFDTFNLTDGQDYTGQSDFSSTAKLEGIELVDANGNLASGWTVTSASGTKYNTIQGTSVPEPGSVALFLSLGASGAGFLLRSRKRN